MARRLRSSIRVSRIWPIFFWVQCNNCKDEVRREAVWRVCNPEDTWNIAVIPRHFCGACAATDKEAARRAEDHLMTLRRMPIVAPCAPPKRP